MKYGFSYYPEHCESDQQMQHEIELIKQSGVNLVRMGEFAWDRFEPSEGQYDMQWLQEVVDILGKNGVESVICTPTACPPVWLMEKYPEIAYVDNRGIARPFGARHHFCYNHPKYRELSGKIALQISKQLGNSPYVIGFQIDNELAQEGTGRCHCSVCEEKFRRWLENQYGSIEEWNKRAGTAFWGQTYQNFEQIHAPISTIEPNTEDKIISYYDNPTLRLEYERFCSESIIAFQNVQTDSLRIYTQKVITTNSTGFGTNSIDYFKGYQSLDVYAMDAYPNLAGEDISFASFEYAVARNIKQSNFWILEFTSGGGHGLWDKQGRVQPYPGALKQSVIHAFASGAELFAHFQFRTFRFGAEQLNYAILDQDGIPRRRFFEVQQAAEELKRLKSVFSESVISKKSIGICMDYDNLWALAIKPIHRQFNYVSYAYTLHKYLKEMGYEADVISSDAEFDSYSLVIVPTPFVMGEALKAKLKTYVANGGNLLSTFLTAVKNKDNVAKAEMLPCGLTDLFGICVEEVEPVFDSSVSEIIFQNQIGKNRYWCDVLALKEAKMLGAFHNTYRKGIPCITQNDYGKGKAYYLGTDLEEPLMKQFLNYILDKLNLEKVPFEIPQGVEVITHAYKDEKIYFIFNVLKKEVEIIVEEHKFSMPPKGFLCLRGGEIL